MREVRIFSPSPLQGDSRVELSGSAARHIAQVLRMQAGQSLTLFDGTGGEYPAVIETSTRNHVSVSTGKHRAIERESALQITLWHGLCRGERMDSVIQKATELGVHAIQPLVSERSVVRLSTARAAKKIAHWQGVIVSACEQCGRNRLPVIQCTLPNSAPCLIQSPHMTVHCLLDPGGDETLQQLAAAALPAARPSLLVCSGPEGGFSDSEGRCSQSSRVASGTNGAARYCAPKPRHWQRWRWRKRWRAICVDETPLQADSTAAAAMRISSISRSGINACSLSMLMRQITGASSAARYSGSSCTTSLLTRTICGKALSEHAIRRAFIRLPLSGLKMTTRVRPPARQAAACRAILRTRPPALRARAS